MSRRESVADPGRLDAVVAATIGSTRADVQRAIVAGTSWWTAGPERSPSALTAASGSSCTSQRMARSHPRVRRSRCVFEDEHLLVVSKPGGLVTHPTARRRSGTLVNRLLGMGIPLAPGRRAPPGHRPPIGCRHERTAHRGQDRCGLRGAARGVPSTRGRPAVPSPWCAARSRTIASAWRPRSAVARRRSWSTGSTDGRPRRPSRCANGCRARRCWRRRRRRAGRTRSGST